MAGDDTVDDGEPKAASFADFSRCEEGLEDPVDRRGVHPAPSVCYRHVDDPSASWHLRGGGLLNRRPNTDPYLADLVADRLGGIRHQVDDDLMQLRRITKQRRYLRDLLDNFDCRRQAGPQHPQSLADHGQKINFALCEGLLAAEDKDLF